MDEEAFGVEHLLELRERVRADGRGEFPRALPVDDHLARLEPAPEQVERCVLQDNRAVVPRLPGLRWQRRDQAVAVEQLHQELPPWPESTGDSSQDLAIFIGRSEEHTSELQSR